MEPIQKKLLGWAVLAIIVIGGVFLVVLTSRTLNTATTTNTVSFSGTGSVVGLPDVAIINFSIVTEAETSEEAQDENSRKSQALVDFLEREDIEERDVQTSGYNVRPVYTYPRGGQPTITGYQVNQSFEVKIRNLDNTDRILDGVVDAGANQVGNLQLTIDDPDALQEEARAKAIADAKKKARNLEQQLGISLGRIVNFSESGYGEPILFRAEASGQALGIGGGDIAPAVPIGENEIQVSVTVTWQIR